MDRMESSLSKHLEKSDAHYSTFMGMFSEVVNIQKERMSMERKSRDEELSIARERNDLKRQRLEMDRRNAFSK